VGRATDDALARSGVGGWAAEGRTMQSWDAAFGGTRQCGAMGSVVGGWAAVRWTTRSRAAAFEGNAVVRCLSWKCRRHVSDVSPRHKISFQFWPDGSVSPTQILGVGT
jgi:hypothetical protein